MQALRPAAGPAMALALATALAHGQEPASYSTDLKQKALEAWNVILPQETWTAANGIPIAHAGGAAFTTERDGLALALDTNGDGKVDRKIKGAGGFAVLSGKRKDGTAFSYPVRVKLDGNDYKYASSGMMAGSVYSVPIALIDQNNNGVYNEVLVDAMIVGAGQAASYLSRVVNLKGELYSLEASADGTKVTVKPYEGPSGTLSARKGLNLLGQLQAAVVSDAKSGCSFEVGGQDSLAVPAGSYLLTGGFAKSGGDTARLRAGKMQPIVVEQDQVASLAWGAPLVAEFAYTREGPNVTVQPSVKFLGRAGEEWHTLLPDAKSPKLEFWDKDNDRLIASKRFEGC